MNPLPATRLPEFPLPESEAFAQAYASDPSRLNRDRAALAARPLIRSIIMKLRLPNDELARPEELFHVGIVAVLQALDQFDPSAGVKFSSFAYPRIRGEIIDFLRRLDPLPRRRRAMLARSLRLTDVLSQQELDEPSESRLAEVMGIEVQQLRDVRRDGNGRVRLSLTASPGNESDMNLLDVLMDASGEEGFEAMETRDMRRYLDSVLATLSDRERMILDLYYGEELTQSDIAALLGVSEARISQIRKGALQKMARLMEPTLQAAA